ncbi:HD-GYP domain-containing protein [Pontibacillus litoralis]|uniref:Hisitidine kinase n=1 Tax=Pontibacillus litoralis JSM 072002 TaxID=1385512 RepID=A0A0A5G6G9_9BACI|nr:HD domain-containing phosphohydrolase [Pontibacillus litoralis]KGX86690.1 hisitidine kinase [Pontibacillus litoralis JSM 072002]
MRLKSTFSLRPGDELAKRIYNENDQILVQSGIALTQRMINRLQELGIPYVYIEDEATYGIETTFPISERARKEAIHTIQDTFSIVEDERESSKRFISSKTSEQINKVVQNMLAEIQKNKEVVNLLSDVFVFDDYIFKHSLNVTIYSLTLGMQLKLSRNELQLLGFGAMLHDVGKITVPRDILMKADKLTSGEFEHVKRHCEEGFNLLRNVETVPLVVAHCAFQHHERLDGSGYPRGLGKDDIHLFSKIIGIADVFDAVTSNRVYRKAMLPHEGLEILYAGAGSLFEKHMIEAFRRGIAVYPNGLTVELSDGRIGIVARQNKDVSDRPFIRILEENGEELVEPYEINLMESLNIVIVKCDTTMI